MQLFRRNIYVSDEEHYYDNVLFLLNIQGLRMSQYVFYTMPVCTLYILFLFVALNQSRASAACASFRPSLDVHMSDVNTPG